MKKAVVLKIRLTYTEKERLRTNATKQKSTMSELIRTKIAEL